MAAAIRAGELSGPSMLVTGPLIAGEEQRWRHVLAAHTGRGESLVAEQARQGFDAVKIYDGLSRETYDAIVAAADSAGVPFVGHVPRAVGCACARGRSAIDRARDRSRMQSHPRTRHAQGGRRVDRADRAWVTPTLASEEALAPRDDLVRGAPRAARDEARRSGARGMVAPAGRVGAGFRGRGTPARIPGGDGALVRALRDAGVLLAGTDTPNPLMVPGYSLHEELSALVAAGLTPFEAIRAATAEAARFAGMESEFGTIREGARTRRRRGRGPPRRCGSAETTRRRDGARGVAPA